ncbi:MAG: substrate-binding domain-containing protein [Thermodesulfobacteriota bacterium]|nr:substrate-binding domain-containing protein [Thermodesulfobacteriota bacterium]
MRKNLIKFVVLFMVLLLSVCHVYAGKSDAQKYNAVYGSAGPAMTVATGSPGALGLLKALADPFCSANHCRINWTKKGSGASLKAMKAGRVDMVMVHAPAAEKKAVKDGWATMRTLLGSNEFYIVGPESDPAGISQAKSAAEAYAMISNAEANFYSRGDNSGTHKKEMKIWKLTGIKPVGSWYKVTGDFMGPTLLRADKEMGYFMTDSSTFYAKQSKIKNLKILFKGDPILVNVYHALVAAPEKYPQANYGLAARFIKFSSSPAGQKIYKEYGKTKFGTPLYNDAEYAKKWVK